MSSIKEPAHQPTPASFFEKQKNKQKKRTLSFSTNLYYPIEINQLTIIIVMTLYKIENQKKTNKEQRGKLAHGIEVHQQNLQHNKRILIPISLEQTKKRGAHGDHKSIPIFLSYGPMRNAKKSGVTASCRIVSNINNTKQFQTNAMLYSLLIAISV